MYFNKHQMGLLLFIIFGGGVSAYLLFDIYGLWGFISVVALVVGLLSLYIGKIRHNRTKRRKRNLESLRKKIK